MRDWLRRGFLLTLVLAAMGWIVWRAWWPANADPAVLPGYLEGETLFMAAPVSGTVKAVLVTRGQHVDAGTPLFAMDLLVLAAQRSQSEAQISQAEAQVAVSKAKAEQAKARAQASIAQADRAQADLDRFLKVQAVDRAAVAQEQVDTARTTAANAKAEREAAAKEANAELIQVSASEAQVAQYRAMVADVQARFDQLSPHAPAASRVQDVFYQAGEWASANQPVVSLVPDDKIKVRFFVPETEIARYHFGQTIDFSCDGCKAGLTAKITYVSPKPEFTPPIIYSRKSRERLVFLVEAIPQNASNLAPGIPVEVIPLPDQQSAKP
jgi:HlyD family secretion protein